MAACTYDSTSKSFTIRGVSSKHTIPVFAPSRYRPLNCGFFNFDHFSPPLCGVPVALAMSGRAGYYVCGLGGIYHHSNVVPLPNLGDEAKISGDTELVTRYQKTPPVTFKSKVTSPIQLLQKKPQPFDFATSMHFFEYGTGPFKNHTPKDPFPSIQATKRVKGKYVWDPTQEHPIAWHATPDWKALSKLTKTSVHLITNATPDSSFPLEKVNEYFATPPYVNERSAKDPEGNEVTKIVLIAPESPLEPLFVMEKLNGGSYTINIEPTEDVWMAIQDSFFVKKQKTPRNSGPNSLNPSRYGSRPGSRYNTNPHSRAQSPGRPYLSVQPDSSGVQADALLAALDIIAMQQRGRRRRNSPKRNGEKGQKAKKEPKKPAPPQVVEEMPDDFEPARTNGYKKGEKYLLPNPEHYPNYNGLECKLDEEGAFVRACTFAGRYVLYNADVALTDIENEFSITFKYLAKPEELSYFQQMADPSPDDDSKPTSPTARGNIRVSISSAESNTDKTDLPVKSKGVGWVDNQPPTGVNL